MNHYSISTVSFLLSQIEFSIFRRIERLLALRRRKQSTDLRSTIKNEIGQRVYGQIADLDVTLKLNGDVELYGTSTPFFRKLSHLVAREFSSSGNVINHISLVR